MKTKFLWLSLTMMTTLLHAQMKTFHDFTVSDIDGREISLDTYKGKKVLVVNVASECGNTPQYETLQKLYSQYGPDSFVVIAFPANNFGAQEPGSNKEIKAFCDMHYHVTFPVMSKISAKGSDIAPVYAWLTQKSQNGVMDAPVTWNFQKFMIDEQGKLVGMVEPDVEPDCEKIMKWLEDK